MPLPLARRRHGQMLMFADYAACQLCYRHATPRAAILRLPAYCRCHACRHFFEIAIDDATAIDFHAAITISLIHDDASIISRHAFFLRLYASDVSMLMISIAMYFRRATFRHFSLRVLSDALSRRPLIEPDAYAAIACRDMPRCRKMSPLRLMHRCAVMPATRPVILSLRAAAPAV